MSMKDLHEKLAKVSEAREALLVHRNDPLQESEEWRGKDAALYADLLETERSYRDAVKDGTEEPAERALRTRIECRNYIQAALRDQKLSGAEAEFNKEHGLLDAGMMPWAALEPRAHTPHTRDTEDRADDATVPSAAVVGEPQMEVLRRVFETGNVAFLGIRSPSVPFGIPTSR